MNEIKEKEAFLKESLSNIVSPLIGRKIGMDHIHTDENGWDYYIPAKSLKKRHPLIINHYRGPLFMVIPLDDWNELMEDILSVADYINESKWSFGYYWGGGSMLSGAYWQPLEEEGIHDTEKISRYLTILRCRTHRKSSGYMPDHERCSQCQVARCPFSPFEEKNTDASWDYEVQEKDARKDLFEVVKRRIKDELGFECLDMLRHTEKTNINVYPCFEKDWVKVCVPQHILIDMLYKEYHGDIEELVNSWNIIIGIPWLVKADIHSVPLQKGAGKTDAYKIWQEKCPEYFKDWGIAPKTEEKPKKLGFFATLFHRKVKA